MVQHQGLCSRIAALRSGAFDPPLTAVLNEEGERRQLAQPHQPNGGNDWSTLSDTGFAAYDLCRR
jgi:hypothetical protein